MKYKSEYYAYLEKQKQAADSTVNAYAADLEQFDSFMAERSKSAEKAGNADIVAYLMMLRSEGKNSATINRKLASVRSYFNYLESMGRISANPTRGIKSPRVEKPELEYLSVEEVEMLLSAPDDSPKGKRDRAMLELMYATGLKANEITEANVSDLDLRIGFISCKLSSKPRIIPIGRPARAALSDYIENVRPGMIKGDSDALFVNYLGERLTRQGIWKIVKFYGDKCEMGDKISPHILRNSFAAHMIINGADIKSLQELLGHDDINATKIYLSVRKNRIMDVYDKAFPRA